MNRDSLPQNLRGILDRFVHTEALGSIVLLACTVTAVTWANSPWSASYFDFINTKLGVSWRSAPFALPIQLWVNDLVMAVFFFMVGLEIKRELVVGELSSFERAALPVAAAIGGMIVPALIYAAFNRGGNGAHGWAIPMATDIAFALGALSIAGSRVPPAVKIFLTALAIVDDLGAVLVLAFFYSTGIRVGALAAAGACLVLIALVARTEVRRTGVYVVLSLGVWAAVFASGVHATLAGVLVACVMPVRSRRAPEEFGALMTRYAAPAGGSVAGGGAGNWRSTLDHIVDLRHELREMLPTGLTIEERLHAPVAFLCLPLFALCNAGIVIGGPVLHNLGEPVGLGIVLGLVVGKQVGVLLFAWLATVLGLAVLPGRLRWWDVYGAACLAGIGFTMSLFFTELAFDDPQLAIAAKIGILAASLAAAAWGSLIFAARPRTRAAP